MLCPSDCASAKEHRAQKDAQPARGTLESRTRREHINQSLQSHVALDCNWGFREDLATNGLLALQ